MEMPPGNYSYISICWQIMEAMEDFLSIVLMRARVRREHLLLCSIHHLTRLSEQSASMASIICQMLDIFRIQSWRQSTSSLQPIV
jgi:hypothetical protein